MWNSEILKFSYLNKYSVMLFTYDFLLFISVFFVQREIHHINYCGILGRTRLISWSFNFTHLLDCIILIAFIIHHILLLAYFEPFEIIHLHFGIYWTQLLINPYTRKYSFNQGTLNINMNVIYNVCQLTMGWIQNKHPIKYLVIPKLFN